jgi:5-formyltetrahydrofolate cyclo-ligase
MDKPEQKRALRQQLIEQRLAMPDRSERCDLLQRVLRIWLVNRPDTVIGAYWPIKGAGSACRSSTRCTRR